MDMNIQLTTAQFLLTTTKIAQMHDVPYYEAVRLLIYAALGTCPDITFAVQTVSHFFTKPGPTHWEAIKWTFCYLKAQALGILRRGVGFRQDSVSLTECNTSLPPPPLQFLCTYSFWWFLYALHFILTLYIHTSCCCLSIFCCELLTVLYRNSCL